MTSMKVVCRFRPQNKIEKAKNAYIVVSFSPDGTLCEINHPNREKFPKPLKFPFDRVFNTKTPQPTVFEYAAKHLVDQIFEDGQTGAGKTYSMEGELGSPHRGIVPRIVETIFEKIKDADENMEFLLKVSYVEIYLEALRDLLNPKNKTMKIRESKQGVYIQGVTEMYVRSIEEVVQLMKFGAGNRTTSATGMNSVSSRSHGVFILVLVSKTLDTGSKKVSKLFMVDLAGSEKISKTGASGQLLEEAKKINQSLSALGNVMNALSSGKGHVAYRDSVLTRLLSDALGGNCKTTLLIACSPSSYNVDETIGTLRFGQRAKKIKNKAKVNAEKTVAEYKKDVKKLKDTIKLLKTKNKKARQMIKALKTDLESAKNGTYVEGEGLYDKLEAGEQVKLEEEKKEEKTKLQPTLSNEISNNNIQTETVYEVKETTKEVIVNTGITQEELDKAIKRAELAESRLLDMEERLLSIKEARNSIMPGTQLNGKKTNLISNSLLNGVNMDILDEEEELGDRNNKEVTDKELDKILNIPTTDNNEIDKKISIAQVMNSDDEEDEVELSDDEKEEEDEMVINIKQIKTVTQLTPELIISAQKELRIENKTLKSKIDQLQKENLNLNTKIQVKSEKLHKLTERADEIEMECDKLMSQKESLEDTIGSIEQRERLILKDKRDAEIKMNKSIQQYDEIKKKINKINEEHRNNIQRVRLEEQKRAQDFIKQAQKQITQFKSNQKRKQQNGRLNHHNPLGKLRDQSRLDMQKASRKELYYEKQMKSFEQETLEQLQSIRLDQLKLKQQLQTKIEDNLRLEYEIKEKNDEIKKYRKENKSIKLSMKQKNLELSAFGKLKIETDKYHSQQHQKAEETIHKLKLQVKKLQKKNNESTFNILNKQQFNNLNGHPMSKHKNFTSMRLGKQMAIPIRPGNLNNNNSQNKGESILDLLKSQNEKFNSKHHQNISNFNNNIKHITQKSINNLNNNNYINGKNNINNNNTMLSTPNQRHRRVDSGYNNNRQY